jgi:hypothetical protein
MTTTLLDAIAAARAGEAERAQLITADVIRNNPDDPNAWYLLSQLVESDSRRAVYLAKTLSLDPNHPRAREEYRELPPGLVGEALPGAPPAEAIAPDVMSAHVAEVAEAVSAAEMAAQVAAGEVEPAAAGMELTVSVAPTVPELIGVDAPLVTAGTELPAWREPLSPAAHVGATVGAADAAAVAAEYNRPQPPRGVPHAAARPARSKSASQAQSILLGLLILLALVVLGMLAYLIFT